MKITWTFVCVPPLAQLAAHMAHTATLGLSSIGQAGAVRDRVAVVGGDPSLYRHLNELRAFDGEVWAINGAWHVLQQAGIDATFDDFGTRVLLTHWTGYELAAAIRAYAEALRTA